MASLVDRPHLYPGGLSGEEAAYMTPVDLFDPDYSLYPEAKEAHIIKIKLEKGDCAYVPSLWYVSVKLEEGKD